MSGKIIGHQRDHSDQPCEFCEREDTPEGHDGCIGTLSDVMNACCGHGTSGHAYVQFWDGLTVDGQWERRRIDSQEAVDYIKSHRSVHTTWPGDRTPILTLNEIEEGRNSVAMVVRLWMAQGMVWPQDFMAEALTEVFRYCEEKVGK